MAGRKRTTNYDKVHAMANEGKRPAEIARALKVSTATVSRALKTETMSVKTYGEMGVTGLNRFGGSLSEDYLKDWNSLPSLVKTVRKMMDHPIVASMTFAAEMLVRSATVHVEPASEEKADQDAAEFLETCLYDMSTSWSEHLGQAITMAWYGFAPFEIVYKRRLGPDKEPSSKHDDGRIGWRKFGYRSPDTLTSGKEWDIDDNGGIQGLNQTPPNGGQSVSIPIEKLILYRTSSFKNNPQGRSALRGAYQPWYFSKNFAEVEGIAAERMGTGMPIMYLGGGTKLEGPNSDFNKAQDIVRNTRTDEQMGIVIPYPKMTAEGRGALFELISPPSRGMIDFAEAIGRYNQQIAQVLLAQFIFFGLTERGTQALAVRTTDFFAQAVSGWLDNIADTFNRFAVDRLFRLNAGAFPGVTQYPEIEFAPIEQRDVAGIVKAVTEAIGSRAIIPDDGIERTLREMLELPEKDEATAKPIPVPTLPFGQPPGQQPDKQAKPTDPKLDVAEGGETPEDAFAASRFRGPSSRRTWERETNKYQVQIELIYNKWLSDLAKELDGADEEDYDDIVDEELAVLAAALTMAGRTAIVGGANLGLGSRPPTPAYLADLSRRIQQNEDYVTSSFVPAAKTRLLDALRDPDVQAAGIVGMIGYMAALSSRAQQYAGAMWTAIQMGAGTAMTQAQDDGEVIAVGWDLDESAQHCDECPEFAGEYESMDDLMAKTGNRLPGEVQCNGNCRCSLRGQLVDGTWVRI
jgi:hypothetical protein